MVCVCHKPTGLPGVRCKRLLAPHWPAVLPRPHAHPVAQDARRGGGRGAGGLGGEGRHGRVSFVLAFGLGLSWSSVLSVLPVVVVCRRPSRWWSVPAVGWW